jgi:hypothetical protein
MEKLKEALAKIAPFIICWAMGLVTYYIGQNTEAGFKALIAVLDVFK